MTSGGHVGHWSPSVHSLLEISLLVFREPKISSNYTNILDFKLSPCCGCCILSFGWFLGVWILYADVSDQPASSIFISRHLVHMTYEDGTECSEKSAHKIQTPGNHPIESTQYTNIDQSNNLAYVRHVRVIPTHSVQSTNRMGEIHTVNWHLDGHYYLLPDIHNSV